MTMLKGKRVDNGKAIGVNPEHCASIEDSAAGGGAVTVTYAWGLRVDIVLDDDAQAAWDGAKEATRRRRRVDGGG